jgi:signal transduction histidine kinase
MRLFGRTPLWVRALAAMVIPVVLLLFGAYVAFAQINASRERNDNRNNDISIATAVAQTAAAHPTDENYEAFQLLLGHNQLIVSLNGRILFKGPPVDGDDGHDNDDPTITTTRPFGHGGVVTVVTALNSSTGLSIEFLAVTGVVLVISIAIAAFGTRVMLNAIRDPINQAAAVADRLAGGDLDARMGDLGPDQFRRLGRAFDGMAETIQTADRHQEEFLSDLAHEIATPVNGIIGLAGAALDHTIETPEQTEEAELLLEEESARLKALLADLRQLHVVSFGSNASWQWVDLVELVSATARRFQQAATEAGLQIVTHVTKIEIISDPRLIDHIVTNLVTNAIRYTPAGGTVTVGLRRRSEEVVLAITDTGIGISAADRDRIFDRFYRVDASRDRASGGTGLGLAISRRAAITLGGTIELDSTVGVGTEFRLVLPTAPPAEASYSSETSAASDASRSVRTSAAG